MRAETMSSDYASATGRPEFKPQSCGDDERELTLCGVAAGTEHKFMCGRGKFTQADF